MKNKIKIKKFYKKFKKTKFLDYKMKRKIHKQNCQKSKEKIKFQNLNNFMIKL